MATFTIEDPGAGSRDLRVLLFYGGQRANRHRDALLAWLRKTEMGIDARVVADFPPHTARTIDERVGDAMKWADCAIALVTPDNRGESGAPNVLDEVGRWRGVQERQSTLCILRQDGVAGYSNLDGVVYVSFGGDIRKAFEKVRGFLTSVCDARAAFLPSTYKVSELASSPRTPGRTTNIVSPSELSVCLFVVFCTALVQMGMILAFVDGISILQSAVALLLYPVVAVILACYWFAIHIMLWPRLIAVNDRVRHMIFAAVDASLPVGSVLLLSHWGGADHMQMARNTASLTLAFVFVRLCTSAWTRSTVLTLPRTLLQSLGFYIMGIMAGACAGGIVATILGASRFVYLQTASPRVFMRHEYADTRFIGFAIVVAAIYSLSLCLYRVIPEYWSSRH